MVILTVLQSEIINIRALRRNTLVRFIRVIDEDRKKRTMYALCHITYVIAILYILYGLGLLGTLEKVFANSVTPQLKNIHSHIYQTLENEVGRTIDFPHNQTNFCKPYSDLENVCHVRKNFKSNNFT